MSTVKRRGKVKFFLKEKGWGFITNPEGDDVFVHYRNIVSEDKYKYIEQFQTVEYIEEPSDKGLLAKDVVVVEADGNVAEPEGTDDVPLNELDGNNGEDGIDNPDDPSPASMTGLSGGLPNNIASVDRD